MAEPDFDAVVVGASVAGCTAARLFAQRGARVALVEQRPDIDAYKTVCTHFIQPSATPTIERLGLASLIEEQGAVRNSIDLWTPYGGWIRHRGDAPYGYNVTRQVLDPLLRRMTAATPGVELLSGHTATELLARRQSRCRGRGSPSRAPRAARAPRRRRRRTRHARGQHGRRQRPRASAQPLLLLGLLARRRARRRPLADVVHGAQLRLHLPQRGRPLPDPRGAAPRPPARVPRRPRGGVPELHRRAARRPRPQPRHARVQAAGQARPAERQPRGRAAGPGLRRRRRAGLRPALGRGLRVGVPERGMARAGDGRRARRRRGPRCGAATPTARSIAAGSARTTSSSPTSRARARPIRSSARCTAAR